MDLTIFILSASDADLTGASQSDGSEGGSDGAERSVPAEGSGQAEGSNRAAGSEEGGNSQATLPLLVQSIWPTAWFSWMCFKGQQPKL